MVALLCVMQLILKQEKSKKNKLIYFFLFSTINWKKAVDETERFLDGNNVPCILVENKADLLNPNQLNDVVGLKGFANANNFIGSFRTSAKTGLNIDESMKFLIEHVLQRMSTINAKEFTNDRTSVNLDPSKHQNADNIREQQKGGCC